MLRYLVNRTGRLANQHQLPTLATGLSARASGRSLSSWNSPQAHEPASSSSGWLFGALALTAMLTTANCDASKHKYPVITRKAVEAHNTQEKQVWVTYGDGVYDITQFLANHPGGREKLMSVAGKDIGSMWELYVAHKTSPLAQELLADMRIGTLPAGEVIVPRKHTHIPKYSPSKVYDTVIVGAGLSGLQCAYSLVHDHGHDPASILLLEAQDYTGGRVKQVTEFIKGHKIEVGAEFLHGGGTELTKFAAATSQPLREIFCWAHGDGGPLPEPVDHGYGLYYIGKDSGAYRLGKPYEDQPQDRALNSTPRLLRYDAQDADFVKLNTALWDLADLHEDDYSDEQSLYSYLLSKELPLNMLKMGEAGFSNTLCANSDELSLKQAIRWSRLWHDSEEEDGDYTFKRSYACLVDHLKAGLQIEHNTPVDNINSTKEITVLTTKSGLRYAARNVVVTASPHVINSKLLSFTPELSEELQEAFQCVKMNPVTKVIMKFSEPVWPKDLHGMIMVDDSFLLPEVWFRIVEADETTCTPEEEPATAYAVGFTTAKYTEQLSQHGQEEVFKMCLQQLETVFSHLEPKHMSAEGEGSSKPKPTPSLKKASEAYLGGMFWDWRPSHHPYIGGGYCSPLANKPITMGQVLARGHGHGPKVVFAGEATNDTRPGATAHAAMETGIRAAKQVSSNEQHKNSKKQQLELKEQEQ